MKLVVVMRKTSAGERSCARHRVKNEAATHGATRGHPLFANARILYICAFLGAV
jgi:hypothetical protein